MIQNLIQAPSSASDWDSYSFSHMTSHAQLIDAVHKKTGVRLPTYNLHPIVKEDWDGWQERNQQAHIDLYSVSGHIIPPSQQFALNTADMNNKEDFGQWTFLHWMQHKTLEQAFGIGS